MLSQEFVLDKSKNFTSSNAIQMPPTIPMNHYGDSRNQQNRTARPILLFHANVFRRKPALHTLSFSRERSWLPDTPTKGHPRTPREKPQPVRTHRHAYRP